MKGKIGSRVWVLGLWGALVIAGGGAITAPQALQAASAGTERSAYVEVPLSSLRGSQVSGDPAQLPVLALKSTPGVPTNLQPKVELDRSQADKIVAWVTYLGLEDDSVRGLRYRVEMVPSGSLCSCQTWKVVWVGQQYQCQAGRGTQSWSNQLCL